MMDKPTLTVVPIRHGEPLLNDIPGQLEQLAKEIREGKVSYQRVLVVGENMDGETEAYGYGITRTAYHDIGLLDSAKDCVKDASMEVQALPPDEPA